MSEDSFNRIFKSLGKIEADQETMKNDIKDIKVGVADYKKTKNNLIGACVVISASVGGSLTVILKKLGIHI